MTFKTLVNSTDHRLRLTMTLTTAVNAIVEELAPGEKLTLFPQESGAEQINIEILKDDTHG